MTYCDAQRLPEPAKEPSSPKRQGRFILEEVSLGFEGGYPKFFANPTLAAIRVSLGWDYDIEADSDTPVAGKVYWMCADNDFWEQIDFAYLEVAVDALFETPEIQAQFLRWAAEKSKEVPPFSINVFLAEAARQRAA